MDPGHNHQNPEMRTYDGILWQRVERQNEMISDLAADVRAHRERMDAQDSRINRIFDEMQNNRNELMTGMESISEKIGNIESFLSKQQGAQEARTEAQDRTDIWKRWIWPLIINILILLVSMGAFTFTQNSKAAEELFNDNEQLDSAPAELHPSRDPWETDYRGQGILVLRESLERQS